MNTDIRRENGVALILALLAMLLMTALGMSLVLTTSSETIITMNFRNASEGLYAADAVVERGLNDILTVSDWNSLINGSVQSAFIDGPPSGVRTLPDGSTLDLAQAINLASCGKATCTAQEISLARPWGVNNSQWKPYAYGKLSDMLPAGTINSPYYVILFVGDDPSENDNDPLTDGGPPAPPAGGGPPPAGNPGKGVIALRAEAFGPRGAHKVIEVTVARTDTTELERGYTGQRGQDEQNRRARKAAVQTPGKTLQMQTLNVGSGGIS